MNDDYPGDVTGCADMRASCNPDIAHDKTVYHEFCDACEFQIFTASEHAAVERAEFHMQMWAPGKHTIYQCSDGRQY